MDNTPTPAQALGEVLELVRKWPNGCNDTNALIAASVAFFLDHGQYFAGLEADRDGWKRIAEDAIRDHEAAEDRCAVLVEECEWLRLLNSQGDKLLNNWVCRAHRSEDRVLELEGLLREVLNTLEASPQGHALDSRIAASLAASG